MEGIFLERILIWSESDMSDNIEGGIDIDYLGELTLTIYIEWRFFDFICIDIETGKLQVIVIDSEIMAIDITVKSQLSMTNLNTVDFEVKMTLTLILTLSLVNYHESILTLAS